MRAQSTRRTTRWAVLGVLAVGAAVAVGWWRGRGEFRLPARVVVEEAVASLTDGAPHAVVEQPSADPVRIGGIQPGYLLDVDGAYRRAVIAPAPSLLRFRLRLPAGAVLRLGTGVQGDGKRDDRAAGIRFAVAVDGREVLVRKINPAASRHDRRWFDDEVDLGGSAERDVELSLATRLVGDGPSGGTPAWSHLRVLGRRSQARQVVGPGAPNVLVLLVDTLRADRLGCYGATPSPTPVLDRLAADGVVFEHAVAQSSWTMPSVSTLFTGLYPPSHGVVAGQHEGADGLGTDGDLDPAFLSDAIPTLAERALAAGVTTVGVSANPVVSRATNLARGFETFVELPWKRERREWPRAAEVNDAFLRWLAANRGHRFLGYLHYMDVHDPYRPPASLRPEPAAGVRPKIASGDVGPFALEINRRGGTPLSPAEIAHLRALYDASIRSWDGELARLLDGLERVGVRDSTVLVVLADHGEAFQEHGKLKHAIHLYDELLRVPLVVAGPSLPRGRRVAQQVEGIDLLPTVAALLGVAPPPGLPGQHLLGERTPRPAFSETRYGISPRGAETPLVSLRTAEWKLIQAPATGEFELYDLVRDPAERENRWAHAPEAAGLAADLARWQASATPPPVEGRDPRLVE
ncbi:MAG TPA: sulfatase, partial [Candidatus Binatia bacterium]|nr:sulfatase [Candidatus Binatia bacterium]